MDDLIPPLGYRRRYPPLSLAGFLSFLNGFSEAVWFHFATISAVVFNAGLRYMASAVIVALTALVASGDLENLVAYLLEIFSPTNISPTTRIMLWGFR